MTAYRVQFTAIVERDVDVPDNLNWFEAYRFARDQIGWDEIAHSAAAKLTIDTTRTHDFDRQRQEVPSPPSPESLD